MSKEQTIGVIFAGGRGARLGGSGKASVRLGADTLLDRTLGRLSPQCKEVIASTRTAGDTVAGLIFVPDDEAAGPGGPLVALLSAMRWAARERDARYLLTTPVDTPFLPLDLAASLLDAMVSGGRRSAVAVTGDRIHGLSALYELSVLSELETMIGEGGERMVQAMHLALGSVPTRFATDPVDPFLNVNTPEDLARARAVVAKE